MTNPTPTPDNHRIDGIREYEVNLPFTRTAAGGEVQTASTAVRIPAPSLLGALGIAREIADRITESTLADPANPWKVDSSVSVNATVVDDTMSPAELAAEAAHWRRVVAALARKLPGVVVLNVAEYEAADPAMLVAEPLGNGMMVYLCPDTPLAPGAEPPAAPSMQTPGVDPVIEPADGVELPAPYGPHHDPDVRRVAGKTLARANAGELEIVADGRWVPLELATIDHTEGTVTLTVNGQVGVPFAADSMIVARPATIEGYGTDLPAAAVQNQQLLTGTGWMTIELAETQGPMAGAVKAMLVDADGVAGRQTSISNGELVLLRNQRPGWWS